MKNFSQYISAGLFSVIAFACSNNFLTEVPAESSLNTASEIVISPDWGAADYSLRVPAAGNANFNIEQIPAWLTVQSMSGQFSGDLATINCSASVNTGFSGTGIYKTSMVMNIEGSGKVTIPVAYIVEGTPAIQTENTVVLPYSGYFGSFPILIKNNGEGILLWSMIEKPAWISLSNLIPSANPPNYSSSFAIPTYGEISFMLSYDIESLTPDDIADKRIIIASNDKTNGQTVINIQFDMGNPSMTCADNLDFGQTDDSRMFTIYNQGDGLLTWKIDSCPAWLSVSETTGILTPYSSRTLLFTCNRFLLPNEQVSQTFYLITNDVNNPGYAITVSVDNMINTDEPENQ